MSKWSDEDIQLLEELVGKLYLANEELNAKCIAFDAKLMNEEAKVKALQMLLYQCQQNNMFNNVN